MQVPSAATQLPLLQSVANALQSVLSTQVMHAWVDAIDSICVCTWFVSWLMMKLLIPGKLPREHCGSEPGRLKSRSPPSMPPTLVFVSLISVSSLVLLIGSCASVVMVIVGEPDAAVS